MGNDVCQPQSRNQVGMRTQISGCAVDDQINAKVKRVLVDERGKGVLGNRNDITHRANSATALSSVVLMAGLVGVSTIIFWA